MHHEHWGDQELTSVHEISSDGRDWITVKESSDLARKDYQLPKTFYRLFFNLYALLGKDYNCWRSYLRAQIRS